MQPGLTTTMDSSPKLRKTALLNNELWKLDVDIAALQETRLADMGSIKEKDYTFYWSGLPGDQPRIHGVGFAIRNKLLKLASTPVSVSERITTIRLNMSAVSLNLICVYAPTLPSDEEKKDKFYDKLSEVVRAVPESENLLILGDFNARVGADSDSWQDCLGKHGVGKMNANGQRVLELCCQHGLAVTNTYFAGRFSHKVSWMHPRSKHWHQLDLALARRKDLGQVMHTRVFHGADGDSDHSLLLMRYCCTTKPRCKKPVLRKRLNVANMKDSACVASFNTKLASLLDSPPGALETAEAHWNRVQEAMYKSAAEAFGHQKAAENDWLVENMDTLAPLIEKKNAAHLAVIKCATRNSMKKLTEARSELQRASRFCANRYWNDLCDEMQKASNNGNLRELYQGLKKAIGPSIKKVCPLKGRDGSLLTDTNDQLARWVEHYSELYAAPRGISIEALEETPGLPVMQELDEMPLREELVRAIKDTPARKAPGSDGIPADVIKCSETAVDQLYPLLCKCWREKSFPCSMRDAKITTLYKNKGDKGDCNNYRGISLLSVTGKIFARVMLERLQRLAERLYPESQCGFRKNRSTVDMMFSLRLIQEKCREQRRPLHVAFVDLTKAFDMVSRDGLYAILEKIGCPPTLLSLVRSLHDDMQGAVQFEGSVSENFEIRAGVKQGCVLAPTLFGIFFSALLNFAFGGLDTDSGDDDEDGVHLRTRSDGKLFNLLRLRAQTKTRRFLVRELLYADDAALVSHSAEGLQRLLDKLADACRHFSLIISVKKTVVMHQTGSVPQEIKVEGNALEDVESFTYLGGLAARDVQLDKEIQARIGKAATTFCRLNDRAWRNRFLTDRTKGRIFEACVLSILLYGAETWPTYMRQEKKIHAFHIRMLRRILGVGWQDKVSNVTVLQRTGCRALLEHLKTRRLRWLGHVRRLSDGRLPKDILYGELTTGSRPVGRPMLRFRDVVKRDMKQLGIEAETWEAVAGDRVVWRDLLRTASL